MKLSTGRHFHVNNISTTIAENTEHEAYSCLEDVRHQLPLTVDGVSSCVDIVICGNVTATLPAFFSDSTTSALASL